MNATPNRLVLGLAITLFSCTAFSEQIIYGLEGARTLNFNKHQSYYVQLGGFSNQSNAQKFYKQQQALFGKHVVLRKRGHYYSVGIGPLNSAAELSAILGRPVAIVKPVMKKDSKMGTVELVRSQILPVLTLSGGVGRYAINLKSQTYLGTDDNVFRFYNSKGNSNVGMGGLFLGAEHALQWPGMFVQGGLEFNAFSQGEVRGQHLVGIEPETSSLYRYSYGVKSQQLLAMAKMFTTVRDIYHPNLSAGLGASFNRSDSFSVRALETGSLNLAPAFPAHTQTALSYSLGLGVDADISQRLRFGLGYRFSDLGKSALGAGTIGINDFTEPTRFTISSRNNYMNQFIAQLSYIPK